MAEARPKTTTPRPGPAGSAVSSSDGGRTNRLQAPVVHLGWAVEGDDRVRGVVVPVRRGQVDDLEVVGDLAEQLEGSHRAVVVERDERVVEDERWAAIPRHEPDQPQPRRQVD